MLVIALAAALLGGATFAWFTDSKEAEAKFTAGTLILGEIEDFKGDLDIEAPGDTDDWQITIANEGSLDMYYRLYFTSVRTTVEPTEEEVVLVSLLDTEGTVLFAPVLIDTVDSANCWFQEGFFIAHDEDPAVLNINFELPTDTDDDYQGAEWVITLHVEATQAKNQGSDIEWSN
jgi:predicted ribosomally synthesized peptide with SipW-like signal peptide